MTKISSASIVKENLEAEIFVEKREYDYLGEKSRIVRPELRVVLPVKGLDPDCPEKQYRLASIHQNRKNAGIAFIDQDKEKCLPSRYCPLEKIYRHIPTIIKRYLEAP
jgi:hypothetical protein